MSQQTYPALLSTAAVVIGAALIILNFQLGPVAAHMATHIAIMNVVAPLLAAICLALGVWRGLDCVSSLWTAALVQLAFLIAWHAPPFHTAAEQSAVLSNPITAVLAIAATAFWISVLRVAAAAPWHAILALMVTGKLACLIGALLIFAPRFLYGVGHLGLHGSGMEDQQLAGLLMISACPLSYIVAGVVIAAQMMLSLERASARREGSATRRLTA